MASLSEQCPIPQGPPLSDAYVMHHQSSRESRPQSPQSALWKTACKNSLLCAIWSSDWSLTWSAATASWQTSGMFHVALHTRAAIPSLTGVKSHMINTTGSSDPSENISVPIICPQLNLNIKFFTWIFGLHKVLITVYPSIWEPLTQGNRGLQLLPGS